ncbi:MAG: hypothetical protein PGN29_08155 [Gordonia paraffinivorans]
MTTLVPADRFVSRQHLRIRFDMSDRVLSHFLRQNGEAIRRIATPGGEARWSVDDVERAFGLRN